MKLLSALFTGPFRITHVLSSLDAVTTLTLLAVLLASSASAIMLTAVTTPAKLVGMYQVDRRGKQVRSAAVAEEMIATRARGEARTRTLEEAVASVELVLIWFVVGLRTSKRSLRATAVGSFAVVVLASVPAAWILVARGVLLAFSGTDIGPLAISSLLPTHIHGLQTVTLVSLWWAHVASLGFAYVWQQSWRLTVPMVWIGTLAAKVLPVLVHH